MALSSGAGGGGGGGGVVDRKVPGSRQVLVDGSSVGTVVAHGQVCGPGTRTGVRVGDTSSLQAATVTHF